MGRIAAPFGVQGWFRVEPFTAATGSLLDYPRWWIGRDDGWLQCRVAAAQVQGRAIVAKLEGCDDRDAAAAYRGRQVAVERSALPAPAANEFYWADLIGLSVVGNAGAELGRVERILGTGANDVLVVRGERERLIPFIEEVVKEIDLAGGVIRVEWSVDY